MIEPYGNPIIKRNLDEILLNGKIGIGIALIDI